MPSPERLDRWCARAARLALAAAFLSAVASRFGLWQGHLSLDRFAQFIEYTAEVNAFMPKALHPALAWAATLAETTLGLALATGFRPREAALGSALLLSLFGTAMALSQGLKSPLDYSVYSAAGAALMLWRHELRRPVA
ncbi:MAG TPA: MauE/DoxX family redox-associated membrane protein [Geothrix sp.]|nr:MauE/DoxX family redox-associated membrane protein [Geothrix sp.]